MKGLGGALLAIGVLAGTNAMALDPGNPEKGEQVFKKCRTCHMIGDGATTLIGPPQNGIVGRTAGTIPGYAYSALNKAAGANGLVWTEQNIYDYLPDPNANVLRAAGILVLTLSTDQISAITRFGDRSLITRFGLPRTLPCS